jgi:DNA/RNA-binding domain of Phe-tRNA-synthetase-like protein
MMFRHLNEIWNTFPELVPGVLFAEGIDGTADIESAFARYSSIAGERLASTTEAELPEIQAWRRIFSRMGLKPTQYRCASESLLRRFRQQGPLPRLHPLVDLCNSLSLAFAVPIAVFDATTISGDLEVRHATGNERYLTSSGAIEHPAAREVVFADDAGQAHARRWTNRQSGLSAVRDATTAVLIVAEAVHASAPADIAHLVDALADELDIAWSVTPKTAILSKSTPCFEP